MFNLRITPIWTILLVSTFGVLCVTFTLLATLNQPYLGLQLDGESIDGAWVVKHVDLQRNLPSQLTDELTVGVKILAVTESRSINGRDRDVVQWQFSPSDPDSFSHYDQYNQFFHLQEKISRLMRHYTLGLILKNGQVLDFPLEGMRPLRTISFAVWACHAIGLLALIIGAFVLVFAQNRFAATHTFLAAVGYFITQLTNGFYISREFALPGDIFLLASILNHAGALFFAFFTLVVLLNYPKRIVSFPVHYVCYAAIIFFFINDVMQWVEWPIHTFLLPFFLPLTLACVVMLKQWRESRGDAISRAIIIWLSITFVIVSTLVVALYFMPQLFGMPPLVNIWVASSMLFLMYIGIVAGIARFRLFDVETIWYHVWLWSLGGFTLLCCDAFLVYVVNFAPATALAISLVLVGWAWFPMRQYLLAKFIGKNHQIENFLPDIVGKFLSVPETDLHADDRILIHWRTLLDKAYQFSGWQLAPYSPCSRIGDHGLTLNVPVPIVEKNIVIRGKHQGKRLFNKEDEKFVNSAVRQSQQVIQLRVQSEKSRSEERQRIMRDLHDDVCPLLLSMIHQHDQSSIVGKARTAFKCLRDTIYSLDDDRENELVEMLIELEAEVRERIMEAGLSMSWRQSLEDDVVFVSARRRINLKRVLHEIVSNTIKHSEAKRLDFCVKRDGDSIMIEVQDDNVSSSSSQDGDLRKYDPKTWKSGKGLHNMRIRMAEINGEIDWCRNQQGLKISLVFDLDDSENEKYFDS